ncbi:hypothetical protein, partial [Salmonella enterica]|uniref:hypothetical protein n=1 Tax=Salmonella enterica TaxID=28901 RepID=UPI001C994867
PSSDNPESSYSASEYQNQASHIDSSERTGNLLAEGRLSVVGLGVREVPVMRGFCLFFVGLVATH